MNDRTKSSKNLRGPLARAATGPGHSARVHAPFRLPRTEGGCFVRGLPPCPDRQGRHYPRLTLPGACETRAGRLKTDRLKVWPQEFDGHRPEAGARHALRFQLGVGVQRLLIKLHVRTLSVIHSGSTPGLRGLLRTDNSYDYTLKEEAESEVHTRTCIAIQTRNPRTEMTTSIEELHRCFVNLSGMDVPLNSWRTFQWEAWLAAGFTVADLMLVLAYLKTKIKFKERRIESLKFSNLIGNRDRWEEDLALARAEQNIAAKSKRPRPQWTRAASLTPAGADTAIRAGDKAGSILDLVAQMRKAAQ